jgi:hypothetical protein
MSLAMRQERRIATPAPSRERRLATFKHNKCNDEDANDKQLYKLTNPHSTVVSKFRIHYQNSERRENL